MVKKFPMVAFQLETQRLAVGTKEGPIAIYDVRTSAKWRILEGHRGNITSLSFNKSGNLLVSYSAIDVTLKIWKVGNTGFFSSIMGSSGKPSQDVSLTHLVNAPNPHRLPDSLRDNKLLGMASKNDPSQGNDSKINKCHCSLSCSTRAARARS